MNCNCSDVPEIQVIRLANQNLFFLHRFYRARSPAPLECRTPGCKTPAIFLKKSSSTGLSGSGKQAVIYKPHPAVYGYCKGQQGFLPGPLDRFQAVAVDKTNIINSSIRI